MRAVRLTWTIGGLGLVLCGVIGMMQYALPYAGSVLAPTRELVFAAAVVLFAVGVTKEASVVARRPLGVIALVVLALWPLAMPWPSRFCRRWTPPRSMPDWTRIVQPKAR